MTSLAPEGLEAIRQYDTCIIANAIEGFGKRLRNEGFTLPGLHCMTGGFPRFIGYAATCRVRSSDPPIHGASYRDRTEWWDEVSRQAAPRLAVIQDLDPGSGGSVAGEVNGSILKALGCSGLVTNGAVRDLPALMQLDFPILAAGAAVSHAYAHIVDFGAPVEIFGLQVRPGELLYADCHGAISIPAEIAAEIPRVAAEIRAKEERIAAVCRSPEFSRERLLEAIG